jgi:hypothetical protein
MQSPLYCMWLSVGCTVGIRPGSPDVWPLGMGTSHGAWPLPNLVLLIAYCARRPATPEPDPHWGRAKSGCATLSKPTIGASTDAGICALGREHAPPCLLVSRPMYMHAAVASIWEVVMLSEPASDSWAGPKRWAAIGGAIFGNRLFD